MTSWSGRLRRGVNGAGQEMNRMMSLKGKWVLITGAASGIGLACARASARRGANVILVDVNDDALGSAEAQVRASGVRRLTLHCDIGDEESVASCRRRVEEAGVAPDVLINNAGVAFLGGFMETSVEVWRRTFEVNVFGTVRMTRAFLPAMRAAGGVRSIVNVASLAGVLPPPNLSAYAASKGAVKLFSEVLAMELRGSNIRVHCVYPGVINTPIVSSASAVGANISPEQRKALQSYYASKGGSPDGVAADIARAVLRDEAHVFTGPKAALAQWAARVSPRLARRLSLSSAKQSGYLPADA